MDELELIEAFKRHGPLVGYKLIRPSNCGFIDFERVEDAASARAALHDATFSNCEIRVEFKVQILQAPLVNIVEGHHLGADGLDLFLPMMSKPCQDGPRNSDLQRNENESLYAIGLCGVKCSSF